jgi:hypothetical protein
MYGPTQAEDGERVDESFLEQQTPGYERPWRGDLEKGREDPDKMTQLLHSKKSRKTFAKRLQVWSLLLHVHLGQNVSDDSDRIIS